MAKRTRYCLIAWAVALVCANAGAQDRGTLIHSRNLEPARAATWSYSSTGPAHTDDVTRAHAISLDGDWRFTHFHDPDALPDVAAIDESMAEDWPLLRVPGNWPLQGFGRVQYTTAGRAAAHEYGVYFRSFTLDDSQGGRETYIYVESVQTTASLWVNGVEIGRWNGSSGPAEFRITHAVRPGENTIALQVESAGFRNPELEGWVIGGIGGSVMLHSVPQTHLRDLAVHTMPAKDSAGAIVHVEAAIRNLSPERQTRTLAIQLYDPKGNPVIADPLARTFAVAARTETRIYAEIPVIRPQEWTAETPHFYRAVATLSESEDEGTDVRTVRFGVRTVTVSGSELRVNDVPIAIRGVTWNAFSPVNGTAMSRNEMLNDIIQMKRANVNTIYLDGRVPPIEFFELCGDLGMYVIVNAGALTHDGSDAWQTRMLDTVQRTRVRLSNHPSIIGWLVRGAGHVDENVRACAAWLRENDPQRAVIVPDVGGDAISDIDLQSPAISTPTEISSKPAIALNFVETAGNGAGGLADAWQVIDRDASFIGGILPAWSDDAVARDTVYFVEDSAAPGRFAIASGDIAMRNGRTALINGFAVVSGLPPVDNPGDFSLAVWLTPVAPLHETVWVSGSGFRVGMDDMGVIFFEHGADILTTRIPSEGNGDWLRIIATSTEDSMAIHVSDGQSATAERTDSTGHSGSTLYIGRDPDRMTPSDSAIARVAMYSRVISAEELDSGDNPGDPLVDIDFGRAIDQAQRWYASPSDYGGNSAFGHGIVAADRAERPAYHEVKDAYSPIRVNVIDAASGKIEVHNRHAFRNLSGINLDWRLEEDGFDIESGSVPMPALAPGERQELWVPFATPRPRPGATYTITTAFSLREEQKWAPVGHVVARDQFIVPLPVAPTAHPPTALPVELKHLKEEFQITSARFAMVFDKTSGLITRWQHDGRDVVAAGPAPHTWRAPTAVDRIAGLSDRPSQPLWSTESVEAESMDDTHAVVRVVQHTDEIACTFEYTIAGDGRVQLDMEWSAEDDTADVPRLGINIIMPPEYGFLRWFGNGPHENYPDRNASAILGRYQVDAAFSPMPYLTPQDYGNRGGVRWAALLDQDGFGLSVEFDTPDNVSAHPYTAQQLAEVRHAFALQPASVMTFNIDPFVTGLNPQNHPQPWNEDGVFNARIWFRPI